MQMAVIDNIYYIPVNATPFPEVEDGCLERHVSAHVFHLQVCFLVTIIVSCT
jgi:hypothetical protein